MSSEKLWLSTSLMKICFLTLSFFSFFNHGNLRVLNPNATPTQEIRPYEGMINHHHPPRRPYLRVGVGWHLVGWAPQIPMIQGVGPSSLIPTGLNNHGLVGWLLWPNRLSCPPAFLATFAQQRSPRAGLASHCCSFLAPGGFEGLW